MTLLRSTVALFSLSLFLVSNFILSGCSTVTPPGNKSDQAQSNSNSGSGNNNSSPALQTTGDNANLYGPNLLLQAVSAFSDPCTLNGTSATVASFSGQSSGQLITLGNGGSSTYPKQGTIAFWMQPTLPTAPTGPPTDAAFPNVFTTGTLGNSNDALRFEMDAANGLFAIVSGNTNGNTGFLYGKLTDLQNSQQNWNFVVFVFDQTSNPPTVTGYLNGTQVVSAQSDPTFPSTYLGFTWGAGFDANRLYIGKLAGAMYASQAWNSAAVQAELACGKTALGL